MWLQKNNTHFESFEFILVTAFFSSLHSVWATVQVSQTWPIFKIVFYLFIYLFPASYSEDNELSWDTSDWESAWEGGDNKEEESTSDKKVCLIMEFDIIGVLMSIYLQGQNVSFCHFS